MIDLHDALTEPLSADELRGVFACDFRTLRRHLELIPFGRRFRVRLVDMPGWWLAENGLLRDRSEHSGA